MAEVAKEVDGKTLEEVEEYSAVFWKRHKELNDWERIIKNIERGEGRIQRQQDIMTAIASKLDRYRNPWQELKLQYGANKGKAYTGGAGAVNMLTLESIHIKSSLHGLQKLAHSWQRLQLLQDS